MKRFSKTSKVPMAVRAEEAFKKAVANAIAEHKKAGHPIAVWRDGRVVHIPADQIEMHETRAEYSTSRKRRK
ncbi:MAG: hypothetical protein ABH969_06735 [Pseudomonadota bacterium]